MVIHHVKAASSRSSCLLLHRFSNDPSPHRVVRSSPRHSCNINHTNNILLCSTRKFYCIVQVDWSLVFIKKRRNTKCATRKAAGRSLDRSRSVTLITFSTTDRHRLEFEVPPKDHISNDDRHFEEPLKSYRSDFLRILQNSVFTFSHPPNSSPPFVRRPIVRHTPPPHQSSPIYNVDPPCRFQAHDQPSSSTKFKRKTIIKTDNAILIQTHQQLT